MKEKILDLADFAPRVFYLFRFLQNTLVDKTFFQKDQEKTYMENFLRSKPDEFYPRGMNKQPDKRQV